MAIELIIEGNEVKCQWWTPEVKELFCKLCPKKDKNCDPIECQVNNPWCG